MMMNYTIKNKVCSFYDLRVYVISSLSVYALCSFVPLRGKRKYSSDNRKLTPDNRKLTHRLVLRMQQLYDENPQSWGLTRADFNLVINNLLLNKHKLSPIRVRLVPKIESIFFIIDNMRYCPDFSFEACEDKVNFIAMMPDPIDSFLFFALSKVLLELYHSPLPNQGTRIIDGMEQIHFSLSKIKNVKKVYFIDIKLPFLGNAIKKSKILDIVKYYVDDNNILNLIKELMYLPVLEDEGHASPIEFYPRIGEITRIIEDIVLTELIDKKFAKKFPGISYTRFLSRIYIVSKESDKVFFDKDMSEIYSFLASISLEGNIYHIIPGTYIEYFNIKIGVDYKNNIIVGKRFEEQENPVLTYIDYFL